MSWQRRIATISCAALFSIGCTYGLHSCISSAWSFDQTGLNMWLDANDINATGNPANNPAQLSSVSLWKDKSGHGNNAFQAPVGDPDNPEPDAASFPGSSGGVTHAEIIGPLPPAPVYEKTRNVTPSGLPAVRFNTCNDAPQFPGCNVSPPTYPTQTALMTNYYAPPDPSMVQYNLANYSGSPNTPPAAVPDLTVVAVVDPTWINDFHPIWSFDGNLGGHNRSLAAIHDWGPNHQHGLLTDGGGRIFYPDDLSRWMIVVMTFDYDGTASSPGPKPAKLYVSDPNPLVSSGAESIQGYEVSPMTIGFFPQNYVNGSNITMLLSEFMVFQRTLTDAQVDALGYELGKKYKITTTFTPPGDYNNDGIVNAADFVVWRKNVGTTNVLPNDPVGGTIGSAQYDQWRANFGNLAGTGLGSGSEFGAVPEPATPLLLLSIAIGWFTLRRRLHAFDEPGR